MKIQNDSREVTKNLIAPILTFLAIGLFAAPVSAGQIYWTDWTGGDLAPGTAFAAQGTITTPNSTVTVNYSNANGVGFYQPSGGNNYWSGGTDGPLGLPITHKYLNLNPAA